MKHLPTEVLSEVFTYLHQNDQLRCMLVCSHWKIIMDQYALYHTVAIYSKVGFQSLVNKVKNHPYIGRRIERLAFLSGSVDASLLLPFLHNLRELSCVDISTSNMYHTRNHSFHRHIEYVSEAGTHSFTHSLLLNGVCPKLTSLKVCGPDIDTFIIPLLNNAPALKELELGDSSIFFDDLEHIHMNVPGLTSLKLNRFSIIPLDLEGVVIEPAASMKKFTFDILHSDQHISEELLSDYICRKYPNLIAFSYDNRERIYTEDWNLAEDAENLDVFYPEYQPLTDDGVNAEWNILIKRLGPQLKKFSPFGALYPFNAFQVLDDYEPLTLKACVFPIKHSLQSLELKHTGILSLDWLKDIQKLEKLKVISSDHTSIRLLDITSNSPPTLSSLSLCHGELIIGHENPYTTPPSNLKVLSISNMLVKNEVGPYIVHGLPQLNGLTIRYCNPRNLVLDLSGINVFVLLLDTDSTRRVSFKRICLCLSLLQDVRKLYFADICNQSKGACLIPFQCYKNIQVIVESQSHDITYKLLVNNTCPNLTTLKVKNRENMVVPLLQHAPALKYLTLYDGSIYFFELDYIHENLPQPVSFECNDMTIVHEGLDYSIVTTPAASIQKCVFNITWSEEETGNKLLEYIYKKYTNVSTLAGILMEESSGGEGNLDQNIWIKLIKRMGPRLKSFAIYGKQFNDDIFTILDDCKCRLESLSLHHFEYNALQSLHESVLSSYIKTLELCDIVITDFVWLKYRRLLRKFKLVFRYHSERYLTFMMGDILREALPSLTAITFKNMTLKYNDKYTGTPPNIERLSFNNVDLAQGIDFFISQYVPKLTALKLKSCGLTGAKFILLNVDLHRFHLKMNPKLSTKYVVLISTLNEQHWYLSKCRKGKIDKEVSPFITSGESLHVHNMSTLKPAFTLVCKSLGNLVLM